MFRVRVCLCCLRVRDRTRKLGALARWLPLSLACHAAGGDGDGVGSGAVLFCRYSFALSSLFSVAVASLCRLYCLSVVSLSLSYHSVVVVLLHSCLSFPLSVSVCLCPIIAPFLPLLPYPFPSLPRSFLRLPFLSCASLPGVCESELTQGTRSNTRNNIDDCTVCCQRVVRLPAHC